ncbi:RAMP superfamily CRISPR-associated protein [Thermoanaerobacter uzonensis]|uniref:RAMP superfamily CRISPR-associated protein n=1 Tax=Thermoanaerobacter uzonensis TaxID=447593 RepID=UPI003D766710
MSEDNLVKEFKIYGMATDPIYIGTGGYTIGRVDNTIVRDPITKLPKIPGSSLAGTWRYYVTLELILFIKSKIEGQIDSILDYLKNKDSITDDEKRILLEHKELLKGSFNELKKSIYKILNINSNGNDNESKKNRRKTIHEKLKQYFEEDLQITSKNTNKPSSWKYYWKYYKYNKFSQITCAGQDNTPQEELSNAPYSTDKEGKTGHCGHCIVCKGFGFSKKDISWQGMIYFSDLNILFFPVFTRLGTKWITTEEILKNAGLYKGEIKSDKKENDDLICFTLKKQEKNEEEGHINLGWLYLPYKVENKPIDLSKINGFGLNPEDIIIVPKELFSQIVNSNLEVRTSVSIDPITGAAKEGALFTSEAIPRGTIFSGDLRINDKSAFKGLLDKIGDLPDYNMLKEALCDSKHFFETLGIGGMTTRGFGKLKIFDFGCENKNDESKDKNSGSGKSLVEGGSSDGK